MTPLIQTILFRVGGLPKESIDSSKVSFWLFGWDKMTPRVKMTPWRGQNDFIEKELKWLLWFKTTLFRVGGLPKELVDSSKVSFWLLGGVEMTPKVKMTPWRSQNDFLLKESKWLYGVKTTPFILQCRGVGRLVNLGGPAKAKFSLHLLTLFRFVFNRATI